MYKLFIFSLVTLLYGCTGTSNVLDKNQRKVNYIFLPEYSKILEASDRIEKIIVEIDCVGVLSVTNIPDFWNVHIISEGETYFVTIEPTDAPKDIKNSSPLGFALSSRGLWSDCLGGTAKFFLENGANSKIREMDIF